MGKFTDILAKTTRPKVCGSCGGKGEYEGIGEYKCDSCCGTGLQRGMFIQIGCPPCRTCNGSGRISKITYITCKSCHGSGYKN